MQNFKQIFDKSQSGVILFSFGTFFDHSTFTPEARDIFLQAFRRFPTYDVIWKLDVDERNATSTDVPSNVHIFKWIDQKAILGMVALLLKRERETRFLKLKFFS